MNHTSPLRTASRWCLAIAALVLTTLPALAEGPAYWKARDAECRGNVDRMIAELQRHPPAAPVRLAVPLEHLATTLEANGRFRELGLDARDGRRLLRALYQHFGVPETRPAPPAIAKTEKRGIASLPGYRPRGEFETIDAVLITWPDTPVLVDEFITMIKTIHAGQAWVYFLVKSPFEQRRISRTLGENGVDLGRISWITSRRNSMWVRDYGPVFLYDRAGSWAVADFHYFSNRPADDRTPVRFASLFGAPVVDRQRRENVVFTEGGNLMTDGLGAIVYSSRTYSGNPRTDPGTIDARIGSALQSTRAFVPDPPSLDGTGHVDMFLKIIKSDTVVIGRYREDQPDYTVLEEAASLFASGLNGAGKPWNIIRVPMPDVYYAYFGLPVVRTYINGLMVNNQFIVPTYGLPEDAEALNILAAQLPGKTLVPINANEIIESLGAWHCVTMEFPRP
jgi:agmatine deiminase